MKTKQTEEQKRTVKEAREERGRWEEGDKRVGGQRND